MFVAAIGATYVLQGAWDHVPLIGQPSVEHEPWAHGVQARPDGPPDRGTQPSVDSPSDANGSHRP